MLDAGVATFGRRRICALRMRVSISPIGSFTAICLCPLLPARLDHARDQTLGGQLTQLVAAHLELAVVAASAARDLAAIADADLGAVARHLGQLQARCKALLGGTLQIVGDRLQALALGSVLGDQLAAAV